MRHLCFNMSGASTLRQALRQLGRPEPVIKFYDDFSIGPIADSMDEARRAWLRDFYGGDDRDGDVDELFAQQDEAWQQILDPSHGMLRVWLSRRSTLEYCSFLEFLRRFPEETVFELTDFTGKYLNTGIGGSRPVPVASTGLLIPKQWIDGANDAKRMRPADFQMDMHLWRRLMRENAPLRAFSGGQLISVPADHHDADLLGFMTTTWRRAARVIGECMSLKPEHENFAEAGDLWLWRRIEAMAEMGVIDLKDGTDIRTSEVRLREMKP